MMWHWLCLIFVFSPILVLFVLRFYIRKTRWCTSKRRLDGRTAVVTGSSSGTGKAIALDLAKRGCKVILACRNPIKAQAAVNEIRKLSSSANVHFMKLDLASLHSVRYFVKEFESLEDRLDLLINNAGYMGPRSTTEDGFERSLAVNYLGHFLLTNLLLPKLKVTAPSRIINVSSDAFLTKPCHLDLEDPHYEKNPESYTYYGAYGRSKLAVTLFTTELAKRLEGTRVIPLSVHTGPVKSDLLRSWPGFGGVLLRLVAFLCFRSPIEGAQTPLYAALADEMDDFSGCFFADCQVRELPSHAKDKQMAQKLWAWGETVCDAKAENGTATYA